MTPEKIKKSRRRLIFIASLFFLPLAVSFALYYGQLWRPTGGTNKGELINPARPLPRVALSLADGQLSMEDVLLNKWTWVYIGDGQCDTRCRTALTDTRQARLLLLEKIGRVQRLFLSTDHCCDMAYLNSEHPDLIVAKLDNAEFTAVFPLYNQAPLATAGRIYLVDPLGNLMMSYSADAANKDLLADIKKLLKLSHIG
jgi:cytochrome oxidase Cu insertion factor (SCO1/SenC/PrrC family)